MSFIEPNVESSYKKTEGYGKVFYDFVMDTKPEKIIEFGVRHAYSTICMAQALRDLGRGHIYAYDLWNQKPDHLYQTTQNLMQCFNSVQEYGLGEFVTLQGKDFFEWIKKPESFDLLHIDIDNDGAVIKLAAKHLKGKNVIFEGGTPERDKVLWMENHKPIVGSVPFKLLHDGFPGLSKLI